MKMWFLVVCGVVFASYAFWITGRLERTTLHEVVVDGTQGEALAEGGVVRRIEFSIEHPGVEHDLLLGPMYRPPSLARPDSSVRIEVTVARNGDAPLLDDVYTFKPMAHENKWRPAYLSFTPIATGPHSLTLRLLSPGIPAVHVRIADPQKTDGKRAAGY